MLSKTYSYESENRMDALNDIIARLEQQKKAIDTALAALLGATDPAPAAAPAVPAKRAYKRRAVAEAKPVKAAKKAGGISAEGRAKLRESMRTRWAAKRAGNEVKKGRKKAE